MSSDLESKVQGNLVKDQTIIKNQKMQNELEQKGYGETTTGIYGLNTVSYTHLTLPTKA